MGLMYLTQKILKIPNKKKKFIARQINISLKKGLSNEFLDSYKSEEYGIAFKCKSGEK